MPFKPDGYTSLSPYLIVDDATVALGFMRAVFGVEPLFVHYAEDGSINHAEVRIDDTILMVGQSPGGPDINLHLYVEDVDSVFARAIDAGGVAVQEPMEKGDGDRRGGVRDPGGTVWWLSTMMRPRD